MTTVGMNYQVRPGKNQPFEEGFRSVLNVMKGMQGHVQSWLYKDVDDANSYLIISNWDSKDAFMAFIQSPDFRAATKWGAEEILAGRPSHKVYGE